MHKVYGVGLTVWCRMLEVWGFGHQGGFPKLGVPFFKGPTNKDYRSLVPILVSPYFGKLPQGVGLRA